MKQTLKRLYAIVGGNSIAEIEFQFITPLLFYMTNLRNLITIGATNKQQQLFQ